MHKDDLIYLRAAYSKVSQNNSQELRQWFLSFPELTLPEFCLVMQRSMGVVQKLRTRAGANPAYIVEAGPVLLIAPIRTPKQPVQAPRQWDGEWLRSVISTLGIKGVALAVNRSRDAVRTRLRRLKIERPRRQENPCCTPEWVMEHYVRRKLSLRACARLAGVSAPTISQWLVKFNIDRTNNGVLG